MLLVQKKNKNKKKIIIIIIIHTLTFGSCTKFLPISDNGGTCPVVANFNASMMVYTYKNNTNKKTKTQSCIRNWCILLRIVSLCFFKTWSVTFCHICIVSHVDMGLAFWCSYSYSSCMFFMFMYSMEFDWEWQLFFMWHSIWFVH